MMNTDVIGDNLSDTVVSDGFVSDNLISWFKAINYDMMKPLKWQIPILKVLNYAVKGDVSRIMISAPPQHGKTELIVNAFVSWYMVNNPFDKVILTAYSQQRATKYGVKIRDIINQFNDKTRLKPHLKQDHKLKTNFMFESPYTAELLASGSHGAIMGNPANLIVIDDPIKELADARSPTMQDNLREWYLGSIDTRLRKRDNDKPPIIIVVAQRLHMMDLQGIILDLEPSINGKEAINLLEQGERINDDTWVYMNFPALSLGREQDILNRPKDTPLWSNHKDYNDLIIDRRRKGTYRFEMIMQGNPTREEDYIFKHEWFYNSPDYADESLNCIVYDDKDNIPEYSYLYPKSRFWDLAATTKKPTRSNDFYCGSLISKNTKTDTLYVYDIKRAKKQALGVLNVIKDTIVSDGFDVTTVIEQEPASQSVLFLSDLQEQFMDYNIEAVKPVETKLYRSYELKRLAENGCLKFVVSDDMSYDWIHTAIRELESFDGSDSDANKHDDIVDSLSSGANYYKVNNHVLGGFITY